MASYAADIQLAVKGKAQLNQLEAQLKRTSSVLTKLNKQLNFRAKVQAIRLDTRQATTAIRQLEDRINRLGRTINVNLRVNEREGTRAQNNNSFGIATGGNQAQAAASLAAATRNQVSETRELTRVERSRNEAGEDFIRQREELNDLIQRRTDLERKLNTVANSRDESAQTANRNRLFGGETSRAGNPLTPRQAENAARTRVQVLDRQIAELGQTIRGTERRYDALSQASSYWSGRERRRVMEAADAWDRYEKKVEAAAKKRQRIANIKKGAGVGLGAAAFNIPGVGGIASGALGGAAVGGKAGAIAGGLTAAVLEASIALIAFGADSAKVAADLQKLEMALLSVTGSGGDFNLALREIREVVDNYNAPLDQATAQFTKLAAAGKASGFSIEELGDVYQGLAAANKALGGDSERLAGILLATTQVFSKGKVQAEELRGQIGERLPGAFALFAEATGRTTKELDKALNNGEVTLEDFIKFARDLFKKYDKDAQAIGDSPAEAGARLQKALTDLQAAAGPLLAKLGAQFQDFATGVLKALIPVAEYLNDLFNQGQLGSQKAYQKSLAELVKLDQAIKLAESRFEGADESAKRQLQSDIDDLERRRQKLLKTIALQNASLGVQEPKDNPLTGSGTPELDTAAQDAARKLQEAADKRLKNAALRTDGARELLAIETKIEEAIRSQNRIEQVTLEGEKAILLIRQRLSQAVANETDDRVKQELIAKAQLDVDRVRQQTATELLQTEQDITSEKEAQVRAMLEAMGLTRTGPNSVRALDQDPNGIRERQQGLKDQLRYGDRGAEDAARIREIVMSGEMSFSEAFEAVKAERELTQLLESTRVFEQQVTGALNTIGSQVTNLFTSLINGTENFEEQLSNTLQQIGQLLIRFGLSSLGGNDGQGFFSFLSGNLFAEGGFVTSPTMGIVGEGGDSEYIIPSQKMDAAMSRWSAGARGDAVIDGPMPDSGNGPSVGAEAPLQINITGGVTQFGGEDYIRKDQVPEIIAQAGKAGEARTLRRLQMSPMARRKVGI